MSRDVRRKAPRLAQLAVAVLVTTLAIFGAAIVLVTRNLEQNIRNRILGREGEVLHAVALMLRSEEREKAANGPFDEVTDLNVLLKTSRLKGVIGGRLFDSHGQFVTSFPVYIRDAALKPAELETLRALKPVTYFSSHVRLSGLFWPNASAPDGSQIAPLLEISVPLHQRGDSTLLGVAQFIVEGDSIAAEFAALDRHLLSQAVVIFAIGSTLISVTLLWAFYRMHRADELLRQRTENLVEVSRELALVTKTSAVGVVAAHLLHELKSNVFGLHSILSAGAAGAPVNWRTVTQTTGDMQKAINQVVETLRMEQSGSHYELSFDEVAGLIKQRVQRLAAAAEVNLTMDVGGPGVLPSHAANVVAIILITLIENAIQATPRHGNVRLAISRQGRDIVFLVSDQGSGVPDDLQPLLFKPIRSKKEGGSGIGLALSKQLAIHLNGRLELVSTGRGGSHFELAIPQPGLSAKSELA